jgi:hypothetical protein
MENGVAFENTELGKLLNSYSGNLSPEAKDNFVKEIIGLIEGYDTYHNQDSGNITNNGDNKITEIIKNPAPSNNKVEYPTRPVSIIVGTSNNSLISNKPNPNII